MLANDVAIICTRFNTENKDVFAVYQPSTARQRSEDDAGTKHWQNIHMYI